MAESPSSEAHPASCPNCEATGVAGAYCQEPVCSKRGYHFVPAKYLAAVKTSWGAEVHGVIGKELGPGYIAAGLLGKGSFGRVYIALQKPLLRPVAFKSMELSGGAAAHHQYFVEQFRREAEALALLNHDNIVRLIDYSDTGPYLVMEYIAGGRTLQSEIRKRAHEGAQFEVEEVRGWTLQILAGLDAAHQHARRVIHRDLKPDNIMLAETTPGQLTVKLVDFGLAKALADGTSTRGGVGTLRYMAPEQTYAQSVGPATDLYAVGCIVLELITGLQVFAFPTEQQIIDAKRNSGYDPVKGLADSGMPEQVAAFFRRALAHGMSDRFQDVESFRAGFEQMLTDASTALASSVRPDPSLLLDPDDRVAAARAREQLHQLAASIALEHANLSAHRRQLDARAAELDERERSLAQGLSPVPLARPVATLETPRAIQLPRIPNKMIYLLVFATAIIVLALWLVRRSTTVVDADIDLGAPE